MIALSFPRLRRLPLTIYWGGEDDLLCYSARASRYFIAVNEYLRPARRRVLEGGMAHELCHIEADLRLGPYQRQFAWGRYMRSRYCRIREERAVERRAIELGYGPQLLAFVEFAHRLGYRFGREHGLLYREIRQACIGRWPAARPPAPRGALFDQRRNSDALSFVTKASPTSTRASRG